MIEKINLTGPVGEKLNELVDIVNRTAKKDILVVKVPLDFSQQQVTELMKQASDIGLSNDFHMLLAQHDSSIMDIQVFNSKNIPDIDIEKLKEELSINLIKEEVLSEEEIKQLIHEATQSLPEAKDYDMDQIRIAKVIKSRIDEPIISSNELPEPESVRSKTIAEVHFLKRYDINKQPYWEFNKIDY